MMAKLSWFTHDDLTSDEAEFLIEQYSRRGYQCDKYLSNDNDTFVVQVLLEEVEDKMSARAKKFWAGTLNIE